jgi:glycerophosphoryl diester phosphodiesterase
MIIPELERMMLLNSPFRMIGLSILLSAFSCVCIAQTDAIPTMKRHNDQSNNNDQARLIVIAHRGASGYRPEHTLEAYRLAIQMGADFIEPDLVPTKDGVLIARHENELSGTTDVSVRPEFANRKTTKMIDGVSSTGWFSEDFTLAEIKTLYARERIPDLRPNNVRFNDRYRIPTFAEVIQLAKQRVSGKRPVGIYPETKHPTYFAKEGKYLDGKLIRQSIGEKLIETLVAEKFTDPKRIYIQSFEIENLIELKTKIMPKAGLEIPLVQLYGDITNASVQPNSNFSRPYDVRYNAQQKENLENIYGNLNLLVPGGLKDTTGYGDLLSSNIFTEIKKTYASGIGPWKNSLLPRTTLTPALDPNGDGRAQLSTKLTGEVNPFLSRALAAGLVVHPYTLRAEENFLAQQPNGINQTAIGEAVQLYSLGVQGIFIDQPDLGVFAKELVLDANKVRQ